MYQQQVAVVQRNEGAPLTPEKPRIPEITRDPCVSDLVGERSDILFQRLKLSVYDLCFLKYARNEWCQASGLKVVNDIAERRVKLMEEYEDVLTDDKEQRKVILHCVEETRKLYPDFKRSTLAKKQLNLFLVFLSMCA